MKRLLFVATIALCLFLIQSLGRSIVDLWQKHGLVVQAQKQLEMEKKKNAQIKDQLKLVQDPNFIEAQARNKLLWTKPGESSVIIDPKLIVSSSSVAKAGKSEKKPNWQQWWELFF